jgi:acetyl-CoA carboxylase, biotin carboxylase subunit
MKAKTILIANRGEIAVRVIRAAKALGRRTAVVYSDADKDSLAVHLADDAVNIGPPAAKKSYLNFAAILQAAKSLGADAIHPGYGFLAENADFAEAVTSAGIKFVGPSARAIRLLGDKAAARHAAIEAGVPVVPGSNGRIADAVEARRCAQSIGYPVMIKAAAGGGGRGIRVVRRDQDFESQFLQAAGEASASFGDGGLYIEKFIDRARHIEVQILGDGHKVLHCFERDKKSGKRRRLSRYRTRYEPSFAQVRQLWGARSDIAGRALSSISTTTKLASSISSR